MVKPRIGVLAVQGDFREHLAALTRLGAEAVSVRRASEIESLDGLILPGGESTTIDRLSRVFELREPIQTAIANGLPVYGSCAGMIMLADNIVDPHRGQRTFGGLDITVRRNAFGRQVSSFESDLEVNGLPEEGGPYRAVFIRAPWVEQLGDDVETLATVDYDGETRIVAVRQGNLMATSFHPEITGDDRIHEHFVSIVSAAAR
ncbi:pyridoxal 5'-phosphate synthase glutaminase subunit PdxT [Ornithinimicrobium sp. INDO-MA30-4]|uniref:pyridoxal 5'-phosphate synthase glutaminase subunit PdxT n=1 Tax=Ornithinimicrobium sp. INDO-MA30-4 TaxID=2908651 RepID=UPI001F2D392B|nr:pyridoxal 5'-phosphate synthase glutaminase subunit PdxT [Ornithinimicrobium sp. INDO-MA30-4]UJH71161.1 pyridoxal 5'-phosphate synthase glutaminase subunit PdxT [Ornithinimicrobium sp. INDO-MA30-4]